MCHSMLGAGGGGNARRSRRQNSAFDSGFGPGFGGASSGFSGNGSSHPKPKEIEKPFHVSLEDMYKGAKKRAKISRRMLDGTFQEKTVEVPILPGYKAGTKIRFPGDGNEQMPGQPPQDLLLVLKEKPHAIFERRVDDLVCHMKIPMQEALQPNARTQKIVKTLDGRMLKVPNTLGKIQPGRETVISREGMPVRKGGEYVRKGDLIVKWDIEYPDWLTPEQKKNAQNALSS